MKILQVINNLDVGGAEKLIIEFVPFLVKLYNVKVDVLLLKDSETPFKEVLKKNGIKVHCLSDKDSSVYSLTHILALRKILNAEAYDIVHTHLFPTQYWTALAKLFSISTAKLVTTEHNTTNRRRNNLIFKVFDKLIYSLYNHIICISDKAFENQIKHVGLNSRTSIIYNGINLSEFTIAEPFDRSEFGFSNSDFIITMVAGFRNQKDQDTLIKSMKLLPSYMKLLLVGSGEKLNSCKLLTSSLSLENRVVFTGIRYDIPRILKGSDVIVMSSHYEGLSLSSIEGMSVNRPFIASDVPGLHEIVVNAGVLFKEGDFNELASQIIKLHNDNEYYKKVSKLCMLRSNDYDIKSMCSGYYECYNNLLQKR